MAGAKDKHHKRRAFIGKVKVIGTVIQIHCYLNALGRTFKTTKGLTNMLVLQIISEFKSLFVIMAPETIHHSALHCMSKGGHTFDQDIPWNFLTEKLDMTHFSIYRRCLSRISHAR